MVPWICFSFFIFYFYGFCIFKVQSHHVPVLIRRLNQYWLVLGFERDTYQFFFFYNNYIINNKNDKIKNLKSTNDSASLTVTCLFLLILITIHYRWINITTADHSSKASLAVTYLQRRHCQWRIYLKDTTDSGVFAPRH
jgi:hypothetical protein